MLSLMLCIVAQPPTVVVDACCLGARPSWLAPDQTHRCQSCASLPSSCHGRLLLWTPVAWVPGPRGWHRIKHIDVSRVHLYRHHVTADCCCGRLLLGSQAFVAGTGSNTSMSVGCIFTVIMSQPVETCSRFLEYVLRRNHRSLLRVRSMRSRCRGHESERRKCQ